MAFKHDIFVPYFNATEKTIIYSAVEEAADCLRKFYCFSPREWFNYCYEVKTDMDGEPEPAKERAFAEVRAFEPLHKKPGSFAGDQYQIRLFDRNILRTLWKKTDLEFYPFMLYILTHELVHVARFCQNLHPVECGPEALLREEERVHDLTCQVLKLRSDTACTHLDRLSPVLRHSFTSPEVPQSLRRRGERENT